jgi:hypothetical protein
MLTKIKLFVISFMTVIVTIAGRGIQNSKIIKQKTLAVAVFHRDWG